MIACYLVPMSSTARKIDMSLSGMDDALSEFIGKPALLQSTVLGLFEVRADIAQLNALQKLRRTMLERSYESNYRVAAMSKRDGDYGFTLVRNRDSTSTKRTVKSAKVVRFTPHIHRACRVIKPYVQVKRSVAAHRETRRTLAIPDDENTRLLALMEGYLRTQSKLREHRETNEALVAKLGEIQAAAGDWDGQAVQTVDGWIFSATRLEFSSDLMKEQFPEDWEKMAETTTTTSKGALRVVPAEDYEIRKFFYDEGE